MPATARVHKEIPARNPVWDLNAAYATEKARPRAETIWASELGRDLRRLTFERRQDHYPVTTQAFEARRFEAANERANTLRRRLVAAGYQGHIPQSPKEELTMQLGLANAPWTVSMRPDGFLDAIDHGDQTWTNLLLEIKTLSSWPFQRFVSGGEIDHMISAQVQIMMGTPSLYFPPTDATYVLVENTDTRQLFGRVITFDRGHFEALVAWANSASKVISDSDPMDHPTCRGIGYGTQMKRISWEIGSNSEKVYGLEYKCNYCPFARYCYKDYVRIRTRQNPEWVPAAVVPPATRVLETGADVIPNKDWVLHYV